MPDGIARAATAPIVLDAIGKRFDTSSGPVQAVDSVSLTVRREEFVSLLGPSGCGKSTVLGMIGGLVAPDAGRVLLDGVPCAGPSPDKVALVFQDGGLFPWRTALDNVAFGLELRGVPRRERERIVREKLELVHLDAWAGKHAHELSGGMQQRVGLARAFATDADILLMDEPFSALDPLIRDKLQDELLELQARLRKTIVFVSHDLDEALKLGTHVAIMEGGRIVQVGTPEAIVTRPATEYVRNFVANVNPLNVLRLATLMCPRERLEADGDDGLWLDRRIDLKARLDGDGRPARLACRGQDLALVDGIEALGEPGAYNDRLVQTTPDAPIRLAIEGIRCSGWPVAVTGPGGRLVGVVRIDEVLDALRRQRR